MRQGYDASVHAEKRGRGRIVHVLEVADEPLVPLVDRVRAGVRDAVGAAERFERLQGAGGRE